MRKILIVLICINFSSGAHSQEEAIDVNSYIYNSVYKNIAAYNIKYSPRYNYEEWRNDLYWGDDLLFINKFLPNYGYKLKLDINRVDTAYPIPKFQLYRIFLNSFDFIPDSQNLPLVHSQYPEKYQFFLVALDPYNGDIRFISGRFFCSHISNDFAINKNDPTTFIPYLTLRVFYIGGTEITFKKKTRKRFIFQGYSTIFKRRFIITVYKKDFDHTDIKPAE